MKHLEMQAMTDVGIKRHHNEDCVRIIASHGIAILADGMGGYNAGEVASAMAVEIIAKALKDKVLDIPPASIDKDTGFTGQSILLRQAINSANAAINKAAQTKAECAGMGTTVLVALMYDNRITAAHVGDSRMYRMRENVLSHVTEDHSLIHEQVRRGLLSASDARHSKIKNLVTRALGVEPGVTPDLVEDMVQPGDMYLLSSDGLTDVVADEDISKILKRYKNDLNKAASQLIQMANDAGGPDNISVILISTAKSKPKGGLFSRWLGR